MNPYLEGFRVGLADRSKGPRIVLNDFWDRYQKPLFIVENGLGAVDQLVTGEGGQPTVTDDYRINHFERSLGKPLEALRTVSK